MAVRGGAPLEFRIPGDFIALVESEVLLVNNVIHEMGSEEFRGHLAVAPTQRTQELVHLSISNLEVHIVCEASLAELVRALQGNSLHLRTFLVANPADFRVFLFVLMRFVFLALSH